MLLELLEARVLLSASAPADAPQAQTGPEVGVSIRLFGDQDNNGIVDSLDLFRFGLAFNKPQNYNPLVDSDGDGDNDALDLFRYRTNHLKTIHDTGGAGQFAGGQQAFFMVMLDADPAVTGIQPLPDGLFSQGVRVDFDPAMASVATVSDVVLPADLQTFGLGQDENGDPISAFREVGSGYAAWAAAVELTAPDFYDGILLATLRVRFDAAATGDVQIDTGTLYQSPLANFVDGVGEVIDDRITFSSIVVSLA